MSGQPRLDGERLMALLGGDSIVHRVVLEDRVGSTNDVARQLAAAGEPAGTAILAEEQTEGRGRRGRSWHSPRWAGLFLSVLLRPTRPVDELPRWTLGAAVAACEACRRVTRAEIVIGWPNDLMWNGRKLGGVLAELRTSGSSARELVIGLGLNVSQGEGSFPPELSSTATSLRLAGGGRPPERERVAALFLRQLGRVVGELERDAWADVAGRWLRLAPDATGRSVRVASREDGDRGYDGVTAGLDELGSLRVRRADGRVLSVRLVESVLGLDRARPGEG